MDKSVEWRFWSAEQVVDALPELIRIVETRLDEFADEHRERNRAASDSLKTLPTAAEVREGSRSTDLGTLGFALDVLGRRSARTGDSPEALRLFQAAHEMFRRGNPLVRATKPMRQTLGNALRVLVTDAAAAVRAGEAHAGTVRESLHAFVVSAWGFVPAQLTLSLDELLLLELERVRAADEGNAAFQERLVRDNIETVLALEIPTRLERVRRRWEEIGEHVAPAIVRRAQRAARRAEALSALLPPAIWDEIRQAVERGDIHALGEVLADARDELEMNLRRRLDARPEYREPVSELRLAGGPDPAFVQARELLLQQDPRALAEFSNLHYRRASNTIAKEWYAYALTVFGRGTDIHDVIDLLESAIRSDRFLENRGWTARWNLACALRRLPGRADEALDVLLPVLEGDAHAAEIFELCLLWALEQNRADVLASLLLKARYYEAHLLAALADAEAGGDDAPLRLRDHFRRINRILRDPDRVFPDPRERLAFDELDQLTREFIETSLVQAGVEWFRQRAAYGNEAGLFKNWECAAILNEEAGDLRAGWRCRQHAWKTTVHRRNVDPRKKTQLLRALLAWGQRHGFQDEALHVLRHSWRETSMSEADARVWEQRLGFRPDAGAATADRAIAVGAPHSPVGEPAAEDLAGPGGRRELREAGGGRRAPLALMLDWENIKIGLARFLDDLPESTAQPLRARLGGLELATRLLDAAWQHGLPRQRWAVADWDRPFFEGDQKAVRNARFWSDISGGDKSNASDHVLREKIHFVLRQHPEIGLYIIGTGDGDFHEVVKTLQEQDKQVILWSTRRAINEVFGEQLTGPDRIRIEWLEDLVFGEIPGRAID
jgi:hypothetical protein